MQEITEKVRVFEDARQLTGIQDPPEGTPSYLVAIHRIGVIATALNGDWQADYGDPNQKKYYAWFDWLGNEDGFVFGGIMHHCTNADGICGALAVFKTPTLARYAGKQFIDIYNIALRGNRQ